MSHLATEEEIQAKTLYLGRCDDLYKKITDSSNILSIDELPSKEYILENQFKHIIQMYVNEVPKQNRKYFKDMIKEFEDDE